MLKITREKFVETTGREPEQDDLERCNCEKAGQIGHSSCGWNEAANKPQFEIGPAWGMDMARPGSERMAALLTPSMQEPIWLVCKECGTKEWFQPHTPIEPCQKCNRARFAEDNAGNLLIMWSQIEDVEDWDAPRNPPAPTHK